MPSKYEINGHVFEFDNEPSEQDIDDAASHIGENQGDGNILKDVGNAVFNPNSRDISAGGIDPAQRAAQTGLGNLYGKAKESLVNLVPENIRNNIGKGVKKFSPISNAFPDKTVGDFVTDKSIDAVANLAPDAAALGAHGLSKVASGIGKAAENTGGRFLNFYIKPKEAGYTFGKNPGRGVIKHIGPTMSREALLDKVVSKKSELLDKLEKSVDASNKSGSRVDASPIFEELRNSVRMMTAFPETYASQIDAHKSLATDILKLAKESGATFEDGKLYVDPKTAVKIKRALGELPDWNSHDPKLGSVSKTARKAYGRFDKEIDKAVPESAETNQDISDLIGAQRGIERGTSRVQNQDPLRSLSDMISLATGASIGGVPGAVTGYTASRIARSAPFNTTVGAIGGGVGKGAKSASKALGRVEGPNVLKLLKEAFTDRGSALQAVEKSATEEGPTLLARNKKSEVSRALQNFETGKPPIETPGRGQTIEMGSYPGYTKTGNMPAIQYPGIEPKRPPQIELPEFLESDLQTLARKYGVEERNVRSTTKESEIKPVDRGNAKPFIPSKKIRDLVNKALNRRKSNFGE